jgi:hypothetical protein
MISSLLKRFSNCLALAGVDDLGACGMGNKKRARLKILKPTKD